MEIAGEKFCFTLSQEEVDRLRSKAPVLFRQICEYGYDRHDSDYYFYNQPGNAKLSVKYFLDA